MKLEVLHGLWRNVFCISFRFIAPFDLVRIATRAVLFHQVVHLTWLALVKAHSAQTIRSEVAGGGRKPESKRFWSPLRAGTILDPLCALVVWFCCKTARNTTLRKWTRRCTVQQCALSGLEPCTSRRLVVVEELTLEAPKTKLFISKMAKRLNIVNALSISKWIDDKIYFWRLRNIPKR